MEFIDASCFSSPSRTQIEMDGEDDHLLPKLSPERKRSEDAKSQYQSQSHNKAKINGIHANKRVEIERNQQEARNEDLVMTRDTKVDKWILLR